jgi:hypothetical protein
MNKKILSIMIAIIPVISFGQKNVYIMEQICHLNKWSKVTSGSIVIRNDKQGGLITFSNYDVFMTYTTKETIDLTKDSGEWKARTYVSEVKSVVEVTITMEKKENKYYFKVIYPKKIPAEEFITIKKP